MDPRMVEMHSKVARIVAALSELQQGVQSQWALANYVRSILQYMAGEQDNFKDISDPDFMEVFQTDETGATIDSYVQRLDNLVEKVDQLQTQAFRNMETLIPEASRARALETRPSIFGDVQASVGLRRLAAATCKEVENSSRSTAARSDGSVSRSSAGSVVGEQWARVPAAAGDC